MTSAARSIGKRGAYLATGAIGVALSAGYLALARRLPLGELDQPGAGVFPVIVGTLVLLASLAVLWEGWRMPAAASVDLPAGADAGRVLSLLGLIVAYVVLLPWAGQLVGGFVFCLLLIRLLSGNGWVRAAIQAAVISAVAYLVFVRLLQVQMPRGILGL
ncbi:putative tricarboxylic transport membrane protein [Stella humosa]|uniref:Putative tricarboxylic transport membrane protein n=1 Tax=Stella humosa TaxID=94 RepID=A0A3N1KYA4_9PROT|nr:tripartite tricarboxylate transporter TctB family protein [Stella humosa]ROP84422.1 putative tricarboxylic transport membrane protein [Stella humosa]BBK33941.1 hypothetical protein STHU_45750 [Stella humosa]